MSDEKTLHAAELWRRYRRTIETRESAAAPEPNSLAAYFDRRLADEEIDQIERWLAENPELAEILLNDEKDPRAIAFSTRLADRALIAVGLPRKSLWAWTDFSQRFALPAPAYAAAIAGLILISLAGFELGNATQRAFADVDTALAAQLLHSDLAIGGGAFDVTL